MISPLITSKYFHHRSINTYIALTLLFLYKSVILIYLEAHQVGGSMRRVSFLPVLILLSLVTLAYSSDTILNNTPIAICFSPNGDCTQIIISEINNTKSEILVQAYLKAGLGKLDRCISGENDL